MWLSVAAALTTMALKATAAALTGSVGILSDAMESAVNLVAALVAIAALRAAARPPDAGHDFGHGKAEYLSAALEGTMILGAAGLILWTAAMRLIDPSPLDETALGLGLTAVSAVVNLAMGSTLIRVGRRNRSITLVADGRHLLTDVWTSVGVLAGVATVALSGWVLLDPIIALFVGCNIVWTGYTLLRRSIIGLLDAALPDEDVAAVASLIERYRTRYPVDFRELRTRESGRQRFVYVDVLVPDEWTVRAGHDLADRLENDIAEALPGTTTFTHLEPIGGRHRAPGQSIR